MPSSATILAGLTAIANDGIVVAILWHLALAAAFVALALGWRPRRRTAALLITAMLASVAIFAFAYANPFNGTIFACATVALSLLAMRDSRGSVRRRPGWAWWVGLAMVAFGWLYPHFLAGSPARYLIAAPLGLVPCPTLSMAIGLALLDGVGKRSWRLVLAGLGVFYALFGIVRLGVTLDAGLLVGAAALAATLVTSHSRSRSEVASPA